MGDLKKIRSIIREELSKTDKIIVFDDIDGFYASVHGGIADVYSSLGVYVGHYLPSIGKVTYPTELLKHKNISVPGGFLTTEFTQNDLGQAVRYLYLKWQNFKKKHNVKDDEVSDEEKVRSELFESDFNSLYGTEKTSAWGNDIPGPDPYSPGALGTVYLPEAKKKKDEDAEGIIYIPGIKGLSMWPVGGTASDLWYVDAPNKWTIGKISSHGVFVYSDPTDPAGNKIELDIDSGDKIRAAKLIYLKHLELIKDKKLPKSGEWGQSEVHIELEEAKQPLSDKITFKGNPDLYAKLSHETPGMISWWVFNGNERIAIINQESFETGGFRFWRIYVRDKIGQSWDKMDFEENDIRRAISLAYLTWAERYGTKKNPLTENTDGDIRRMKFKNIPELTVVRDKSNYPETWWVIIKKEDRQKQSIAYISPRNKGKKDVKWLVRVKPDEKTQNPFYWKKEYVEPKDLQSAVRLAYLKWMANMSSGKQEISESVSKWPEHVDYPTLGDVTAIRQSEDAQWWAFMDSDGKYIKTYKVNPDNLAKELKQAAEWAYYKWMGIDNKNINEGRHPNKIETGVKTLYATIEPGFDEWYVRFDNEFIGHFSPGKNIFVAVPGGRGGRGAAREFKASNRSAGAETTKSIMNTYKLWLAMNKAVKFKGIDGVVAYRSYPEGELWNFYINGEKKAQVSENKDGSVHFYYEGTEYDMSMENVARFFYLQNQRPVIGNKS
jgi:hypothetical protein